MAEDKIKISIKLMNSTFEVEIEKAASILNLKQKIKEIQKAEEADQKIIYKGIRSCKLKLLGHILKDEDTIVGQKIQNGDCLHLVVKKKPAGLLIKSL
jgi:hypothetical protein